MQQRKNNYFIAKPLFTPKGTPFERSRRDGGCPTRRILIFPITYTTSLLLSQNTTRLPSSMQILLFTPTTKSINNSYRERIKVIGLLTFLHSHCIQMLVAHTCYVGRFPGKILSHSWNDILAINNIIITIFLLLILFLLYDNIELNYVNGIVEWK